ncbi:MAG: polyprenol monophosphomannose synthase, partial [Tepidisphaerales bacterium]
PSADVLVIDDNSPDGTGDLAERLAVDDPHIRVMHRAGKLGLGTAILAGMRYAMDEDYDYLLNMDADFSHHPRYLPAIVGGMQRYDVMIGSRYIPGGGTVNWPLSRRLMSRAVGYTVRLLMRIPARDTSGAYRCYRVSKLRQAHLEKVRSRGYSFQQEVLYRCRKAKCKIGETPIIFENRRAGSSKVNPREAVRSMGMILVIGVAAFFGMDE